MQRLRERNAGIVLAKNLPAALLLLAPFTRLWNLAQVTIFMPPRHWPKARKKIRRVRRGARAWNEGVRIGLARRAEVWPRRAVSNLDIVRWLLKGSGPVE
jgi:hypothetical protein